MQMVKCMLVGDSSAGKTPLLITYISGSFPSEYVPTIFNCNVVTVMLGGESCSLELWDTSGLDAYDRLHPLIYPQKDVFLVCFSVVSPSSYERVREKWVPEINQHCPNTPFLLVGTMIDLRDDSYTLDRLAKDKQQPLSPKDGEKLAQELGAVKYVECSALTQRGLRNVFDEAILAALKPPNPPDTKSKTGCVLL